MQTNKITSYLERFSDAELIVRAGEIIKTQKLNLSLSEAVAIIRGWLECDAL